MDKAQHDLLKHDRFQEQVGHTARTTYDYWQDHRGRVLAYVGGGILLIVLGFAGMEMRSHQHTVREEALREALRIQEAQVGAQGAQDRSILIYPTQAEKEEKAKAAFTGLAKQYAGTDEGAVSEYYLGVIAAENGSLPEAEQHLQTALKDANSEYASQVKLSLAQIYETEGRAADAEKLLRELVASPTAMVSKEQATISLARVLAKKNPDEARKLLEPLRTGRPAVSKVALTTLSELPKK